MDAIYLNFLVRFGRSECESRFVFDTGTDHRDPMTALEKKFRELIRAIARVSLSGREVLMHVENVHLTSNAFFKITDHLHRPMISREF